MVRWQPTDELGSCRCGLAEWECWDEMSERSESPSRKKGRESEWLAKAGSFLKVTVAAS